MVLRPACTVAQPIQKYFLLVVYIYSLAISDDHCKFLLEQGVVERLLTLIKPVYGQTKCTLEHAALSALRNLAIPGRKNKSNTVKILKFGTPQTIAIIVLKIEKFDVQLH